MPKSDLQKAVEKQTKENQRAAREAQKAAREAKLREEASIIVSSQPIIEGFQIMDPEAEDTLKAILDMYDGDETNYIRFKCDTLPLYLQNDIPAQFEKLRMYGMITDHTIYLGGTADVTISERAKRYFEDKRTVLEQDKEEKEKQRFLAEMKKHKKYDVFISHASKDKEDYVDLLVMDVRRLGIDVFYDADVISWGDNWKQVIMDGTAESEFAIIVISENFFGREWTEKELNEFLTQQNETGQKIVLPLLLNISRAQLLDHYPELTEIQYVDAQKVSRKEIVLLLAKELIKRYK